jgi:flagellar hook-associated protein 3 FlgL
MLSPISNRTMIEIHRQRGLAQALAETQGQIATGRRLARGSDDPVASARIAALRGAETNSDIWQANIDRGLTSNSAAAAAAEALSDNLASARELLLAGANGTASADTRETLAQQLDGIATTIDRLAAQTDVNGQPLFRTDAAITVRYSADVTLAPVPLRDDVFSVAGTPIATMVRDTAAALRSGTSTAIDPALDQLDSAIASASNAAARIGQVGSQLEDLRNINAANQIDLASERSSLEDTDLSEAIARLNSQQLTLEAAQSAFARLHRRTLFDLLG